MKKSFGAKPFINPMPVQMLATYNDDGSVDVMNAAWGGIIDSNLLILSLDETHQTADNFKKRQDFTLSIANEQTMAASDFLGMVSYKKDKEKFNKTGLTFSKSEVVNAPIINEYPLTLLCRIEKITNDDLGFLVYARILDVLIDEEYVDDKNKIDVEKMNLICFSGLDGYYYHSNKKAGKAWGVGTKFLKK